MSGLPEVFGRGRGACKVHLSPLLRGVFAVGRGPPPLPLLHSPPSQCSASETPPPPGRRLVEVVTDELVRRRCAGGVRPHGGHKSQ